MLALVSMGATLNAQGVLATPSVRCGAGFTLALSANGTVRAWGSNSSGELGVGSGNGFWVPQIIPGLSGVSALAAGANFSLALLADGSVKAWGWGGLGALGNGSYAFNQFTPQTIPGLETVAALTAGQDHALALLDDGTVKAWGFNFYGQLGLGINTNQNTPQPVPGLTGVSALAGGSRHTLALLADGTVKAWGEGTIGSLGLGGNNWSSSNTPQIVPGLTNVVAVAAGWRCSFALLGDGTVKSWGLNGNGQLGLGTNGSYTNTPQLIPGLSNVSALVKGPTDRHFVVILGDGTVRAWGANGDGQLGLGHNVDQNSPQPVPGLSGVQQLANGMSMSLALLTDGTLKAWGYNGNGVFGSGHNTSSNTPQSTPGLWLGMSADYHLAYMGFGPGVMGIEIPSNSAVGAGQCYFNVFTPDPMNGTSPNTGAWYGLHIPAAEITQWFAAGANGLAIVYGSLGALGGATASIPVPYGALYGVTLYSVSIAVNPLAGTVTTNSNIASRTFSF